MCFCFVFIVCIPSGTTMETSIIALTCYPPVLYSAQPFPNKSIRFSSQSTKQTKILIQSTQSQGLPFSNIPKQTKFTQNIHKPINQGCQTHFAPGPHSVFNEVRRAPQKMCYVSSLSKLPKHCPLSIILEIFNAP